jgi:peptide-methionine (S)-S-oxide reductase
LWAISVTDATSPDYLLHGWDCYHQQYLAKVPNGYCGLGGTGLALGDPSSAENSCPIGLPGVTADTAEADPTR